MDLDCKAETRRKCSFHTTVTHACVRSCRAAANPEDAAIPWDAFPIDGVTAGAVHAHEEFGVTVDLLADENVVGLISPGQVRSKLRCQLHEMLATCCRTGRFLP
jgi:hypothetical protein